MLSKDVKQMFKTYFYMGRKQFFHPAYCRNLTRHYSIRTYDLKNFEKISTNIIFQLYVEICKKFELVG